MTWTNSWQGGTDGPIPTKWGVQGYPTIYVLDAEGKLRYADVRGEGIAKAVDALLAEMKKKSAGN